MLYPNIESGFNSFSSVTALKCFSISFIRFESFTPTDPRHEPMIASSPSPSAEATTLLRSTISSSTPISVAEAASP